MDWKRVLSSIGIKQKHDERVNMLGTTESIDIIENAVYAELKPLGFRKHGRTLHRFVDGDISQVINFQCGQSYRDETHLMWVNIGIRVPECELRSFEGDEKPKKYYHEYECSMRSRLGEVKGKKDTTYNLHGSIDEISADILYQIKDCVLPAFDVLKDRRAILEKLRKYKKFDTLNSHLILLEEAMIYGRMGDIEKAGELFNLYYKKCKNKISPHKAHLEYLEKLAAKLDITLKDR
jgi:hypothetical protein